MNLSRVVTALSVSAIVLGAVTAIAPPALAGLAPMSAASVASPAIALGADAVVGEAVGHVDIPVTLSAPGTTATSVVLSFSNVTAAAGYDYTCPAGCGASVLTFAPGQTSQTVRVGILNDTTVEGLESFTVNLSSPTGGTITRAIDTVSIVDNDTVATVPALFVRDAVVDESAGTVTVPVLLGGPAGAASGKTVTVQYATSGGTAVSGTDFTATTGTLSFAPGQTVQSIVVPIVNDTAAEVAESFTVALTAPVNATIGDGTGTVTIGANDAAPVAAPRISVAADVVVGEADGYLDVPVTLSAPGTTATSVVLSFSNVTAAAGYDYTCPAGCGASVLTFAPGQTSQTVRVGILNDTTVEGLESFTVNLSSPTGGTITRAIDTVSIVDNDTVATVPALFVRDAVVDESAGTVTVPVLLGGPAGAASGKTVTVQYATSGGTAVSGTDFTATTGTLSFAPGQTVQSIVVPIVNDTAAEVAESFTVALTAPVNATIGDGTGTVTIGANDAAPVAAPRISVAADVVVGEADGYLDVPVTLSAPGTTATSVVLSFSNVTAAAGYDYTCPAGCGASVLTFAPGQTSQTVRVGILNDTTVEGLESFTVNLSSPTGGTITRAIDTVSIVDNDTVATVPALFVRDAVVDESAGTVTVPVLLGGPAGTASGKTVTVQYATSGGTAVSGTDFTATTGTLSFAPGQTVQSIVVPIVNDTAAEVAESFTVALTAPVNATIGDGTGTVTIGANDAAPVAAPRISVAADAVVGEADGYLDVPVTLSAPGTTATSVVLSFSNVTAAAGYDYTCPAGCGASVLTFAPGQTSQTVRVGILNDTTVEGLESFTVNLSSPTGGTITRAIDTVSIVDNDTVATVPALFVRDAVVDESAGTVTVPVLLGGPAGAASGKTVTVQYATSGGTAVSGTDFTATTGTLSFAPGQTVQSIVVPIVNDTAAEVAESFTVALTAPVNATIGDGTGTVTIGANDAAPVAAPRISVAADAVVGEADGYLDVPVTLSAPGTTATSVVLSFSNVTAAAGYDYTCPAGCGASVLTFAPGQTSQTVRVGILNDTTVEGLESFTVNLSSPTGGTITRAIDTVSIADNDAP